MSLSMAVHDSKPHAQGLMSGLTADEKVVRDL